ncbi:MAG: hypothetical protein M3421_14675 [Bacteroidota bacterium]|nr:hypothetical protein [Bacteroidota bacterium]
MFPSQVELLYHILDECDYLIKQKQLTTLEALTSDKTLSHAFCRSIEIIGEAAKKINIELKHQHPQN